MSDEGTMISGCMIDGFGWFHDADYRRTWLLLDQVAYVLPARVTGPLTFPASLADRPEFVIDRPGAPAQQLAAAAAADCADEGFLALAARVPQRDAEYAGMLVWSDAEAREALATAGPPTPAIAIAYLLNKLIWCARENGAAPLVGQPYASDLLCWKVAQPFAELPWKSGRLSERVGFAAFAAGLSLDFVSDRELMDAPIDRLVTLKSRHRRLLEDSQRKVAETARRFAELPDSEAFSASLAALREEAAEERAALESRGRQAWIDTGLAIAKRAAAAGVGLGGGMLILSAATAPFAAIAAAGAVVATAALDALTKHAQPAPPISFLLRAGRLAHEHGRP